MCFPWKNTFPVIPDTLWAAARDDIPACTYFPSKVSIDGVCTTTPAPQPTLLRLENGLFLVSDPKARRKCLSLLPALHILREGTLLQLVQIQPDTAAKPKIMKEKKT